MNLRYGLGLLGLLSIVVAALVTANVGGPVEAVYYHPWGMAASAGLVVWTLIGFVAAVRLCFWGTSALPFSLASLAGFALYLYASSGSRISAPAERASGYIENAWQLLCIGLLTMAILDIALSVLSWIRTPLPAEPDFRPF